MIELLSKLGAKIGALAAVLAGIAALLWRARRQGAAEQRRRRAEQDRAAADATRERMNDAEADVDDDPAVLRDWLRKRGDR